MLLMIESVIREAICHSVFRYEKANNKCIRNNNQNKNSAYIAYYGLATSKDLPVIGFRLVESTGFAEDLVKYFDENSDVRYFFQVDLSYPEQLGK